MSIAEFVPINACKMKEMKHYNALLSFNYPRTVLKVIYMNEFE